MLDALLHVLAVLGGTSGVLALIGFAIKKYVDHRMAKDFEAHKTKLKDESDREIERLRADYKRAAFHFETRFGRLHDEMVKALLVMYPRLVELHRSVLSYLATFEWSGAPTKDEKLIAVIEKSNAFDQVYLTNRILIPKAIRMHVDEFASALSHATNSFTRGLQREKAGMHAPNAPDYWEEAMNNVTDKIKPLFEKMEDSLQELLGFSDLPSEVGPKK